MRQMRSCLEEGDLSTNETYPRFQGRRMAMVLTTKGAVGRLASATVAVDSLQYRPLDADGRIQRPGAHLIAVVAHHETDERRHGNQQNLCKHDAATRD